MTELKKKNRKNMEPIKSMRLLHLLADVLHLKTDIGSDGNLNWDYIGDDFKVLEIVVKN